MCQQLGDRETNYLCKVTILLTNKQNSYELCNYSKLYIGGLGIANPLYIVYCNYIVHSYFIYL